MAKIWYHGGPTLDYVSQIKWDRDRSADQNALGPGFYWSDNQVTAKRYGHHLYRGTTKQGFRFLPRSAPGLARKLFDAADEPTRASFLEDWDESSIDKILAQYSQHEDALDTAVLLYHDLYRYKADAYVTAISTLYDGTIVTMPDGEKHMVCWSLKKMKLEEV